MGFRGFVFSKSIFFSVSMLVLGRPNGPPDVGPLSQDYGAFVDIGLGRTDALMPNSMMGDKVGRRGLTQ